MSGPRRLDWEGLMRTGLGRLRLVPDVFWSMTPREFRAACTGAFGAGAEAQRADAGTLRALMAQFGEELPPSSQSDGTGGDA